MIFRCRLDRASALSNTGQLGISETRIQGFNESNALSSYRGILGGARTKIFSLEDTTVLMPCHGPPSTVALKKAHNPSPKGVGPLN